MATTIQLEEKIRDRLEGMKSHPRETYSQVIERLINTCGEEEEELSPQTLRNIQQALDDVKHGRVYTTKEAKAKLGIK
jgi:predicted transcriptional regulator